MEIRKVQESKGTLLISMPKGWASRNKVSKGSHVTIIEREDGCLILAPGYKVERQGKVGYVEVSPQLERDLTSKYWLGYDSIKVGSRGRLRSEDRERVKAVVRRLVGLEIVEEDAGTMTLQFLLEASAFPPEKILRREYILVAGMERDLATSLQEREPHLAETVIERDEEVDRLYFLLVRVLRTLIQQPALSEELHLSPIGCLDYRLVAGFVESIADQVVAIAGRLLPRLPSIPEPIKEALAQAFPIVFKMHEDAIHAFLAKDPKLADSVREAKTSASAKLNLVEEQAVKLSPEELLQVSPILSALDKVGDYSIDIADMVSSADTT